MPIIKPKKTVKTVKTKPAKTKKVSQTLVPIKSKAKPTKNKNTSAYYQCLSACCQKGIKPKRISQIAHECKTNALTINAQMSAAKTKAVKKIKEGYVQMGKGLSEFVKASQ